MIAPIVTVLIPTHNHPRLIPYALLSAKQQTVREIEIFVVGDGADDATREAVWELSGDDRRIRYFDFPKGERHGESNRHAALQEARGQHIAYLCDDDLWRQDHLENVLAGLANADFVHTLHTQIVPEIGTHVLAADLALSKYTLTMLTCKKNYFGPTVVAHSMASYRALPFGWRPAPIDIWTDLHMWRQFLNQPNMRFRSIPICDTLHFASSLRSLMTEAERETEILRAYKLLSRFPDYDIAKKEEIAIKELLTERDALFPERKLIEAEYQTLSLKNRKINEENILLQSELAGARDEKIKADNLHSLLSQELQFFQKRCDILIEDRMKKIFELNIFLRLMLWANISILRNFVVARQVSLLRLLSFDATYYLESNSDVRQSSMCPYVHFIQHGYKEGRRYRLCV